MKTASDNERLIESVTETSAGPSTKTAVAGSSSDDYRDLQGEGDERAEEIAIDEAVDNRCCEWRHGP